MAGDGWYSAVVSFTTTLGAFGTMVDDKAKKIYKDFSSSPLKRSSLVGGYIISSYLIGIIMSIFLVVFLDLYMLIRDGHILDFVETIQVLGLILLVTLANSAIVFFITIFIKSMTAFATISTVVGTLLGFLAGIYMPVGNFRSPSKPSLKSSPSSCRLLVQTNYYGRFSRYRFLWRPHRNQEFFFGCDGCQFRLWRFRGIAVDANRLSSGDGHPLL
jgi:ABC-type multidrug transport system permease subunit